MSDRNDEHDDRMGLEAFDRADAPDQWGDITRRAESAGLDTVGERVRRSPATWIMAAAAVALVAVAAVAISVRSDDDGAPTPATTPDVTLPTPDTEPPTDTVPVPTKPPSVVPDTSAPDTSVPDSTVPSTSVAGTTSPTTVAPAVVVETWEPDCVDRLGGNLAVGDRGPKIARFSTLGEQPTVDIALPAIDTTNGVGPPLVLPVQVPGGVALAMHEYIGAGGSAVALVVIDLDGSVRWQRCLDDTGYPSALIVGERELWLATNGEPTELRAFYLDTGADFSAPFEIGDRQIENTSGRRLLAVKSWDAGVIGADDRIGVIDLDVFNATDIPYPEIAIGDAPDAVRYELVVDGNQLLITGTVSGNTPDVVWTGDEWSSDPGDLRRLPPVLRLPFGTDAELQLVDGAGDTVWSVSGFRGIGREGFNSAISDSVVLAMECLSWTEEFGCSGADGSRPDERLVGFDLATGDELWTRPGGHSFALIDGDRGIVTADLDGDGEIDGWELIDLRTGERVDDVAVTTWPDPDIFRNACCGEGDYVWTRLDGGVLFESLGESIRVWLPPEFTSSTVSVDLSE